MITILISLLIFVIDFYKRIYLQKIDEIKDYKILLNLYVNYE